MLFTLGGDSPKYVGGYRLVSKLDEGGFGTVYLVEAPEPNDKGPLVMKCVPRQGPATFERAGHEAKLGAAVGGRRFPEVHDVGVDGDLFYLVMGWIEGWNVGHITKEASDKKRKLAVSDVVAFGIEVLEALHDLHEAVDPETGLPLEALHRDVKLSNVMLCRDGRVVLIDLGVGKSNVQSWKTKTGAAIGTIGYSSPEQLRGDPVDRRTDLYSVGVMLYSLLLFEPYIPYGPKAERMQAAQSKSYEPIAPRRPDVPETLDKVLGATLSRYVEARPPDARAMIEALEHAGPWPTEGSTMLEVANDLLGPEALEPTVVERPGSTTAYHRTEPVYALPPPEPSPEPPAAPPVEVVEGSSGTPLVPMMLLAAAIGLVAFVVTATAFDDERPVSSPPRTVAPGVAPRVRVESRPAPPPPPSKTDAPVPAPPPRRARPAKAAPEPASPPPPPPPDPEAIYTAFVKRARALRGRHPEHTAAIDELIADAALWRRATNVDRAAKELRRLDDRLSRLE